MQDIGDTGLRKQGLSSTQSYPIFGVNKMPFKIVFWDEVRADVVFSEDSADFFRHPEYVGDGDPRMGGT